MQTEGCVTKSERKELSKNEQVEAKLLKKDDEQLIKRGVLNQKQHQ